MDPNGKNLACRSCLERKPVQNAVSKESQKINPQKEYFCKECRYSFKRAKRLVITSCPYCNSSEGIVTKGSTVRILADVSKIKREDI